MFSYFSYAAAFVPPRGSDPGAVPTIDAGLVGIALALAPFVFVVVAFISKNPRASTQVLRSMGLLIVLGLGLGWFAPIWGAAAGFGVGLALCLRMPGFEGQLKRRLAGVGFALVYMFMLLVVATPAGVLTGAFLPPLMVGFADEYGAWRVRREADV